MFEGMGAIFLAEVEEALHKARVASRTAASPHQCWRGCFKEDLELEATPALPASHAPSPQPAPPLRVASANCCLLRLATTPTRKPARRPLTHHAGRPSVLCKIPRHPPGIR
ncbi:hypothetical protein E2C01_039636 [Portunus trituberculatus]|uniref:Uncharacterized protein n=1 Tax=Portunus trituberculatus TaxID=210409 RepID=A0A5B7FE50_PORTR|nr:hypothetical protein [Portunus trituberculatus]